MKSNWDLDLRFGQQGEIYVNQLLTSPIETVEVKRDRRWIDTGNIYIEVECWSDELGSWRPAGISKNGPTHWAFVLENMVVIVPTDTVRKAITIYGIRREMNRPEFSTRGFTITIDQLLRCGGRAQKVE